MMHWKVIYSDGTENQQYNRATKTGINYPEIDRTKLAKFELINANQIVVTIDLSGNKKLFYRSRPALSYVGGKWQTTQRMYIVGYRQKKRRKIEGKWRTVIVKKIWFVFETGEIAELDEFQEDHPWFYSINFREDEKV